jgi:hypothetical protein
MPEFGISAMCSLILKDAVTPDGERAKIMRMLIDVTIAAVLVLGVGTAGLANADQARRHHHRARLAQPEAPIVPPAPYGGGRLVLHPANNIACMTRDRATRALPCDQPVWVYGSPCEIDLGFGRYRSCDW